MKLLVYALVVDKDTLNFLFPIIRKCSEVAFTGWCQKQVLYQQNNSWLLAVWTFHPWIIICYLSSNYQWLIFFVIDQLIYSMSQLMLKNSRNNNGKKFERSPYDWLLNFNY